MKKKIILSLNELVHLVMPVVEKRAGIESSSKYDCEIMLCVDYYDAYNAQIDFTFTQEKEDQEDP